MKPGASVHPDWPRVEGRDCAKCQHYELQNAPDDWVIECCSLHNRACGHARSPQGACAPAAKDWVRK